MVRSLGQLARSWVKEETNQSINLLLLELLARSTILVLKISEYSAGNLEHQSRQDNNRRIVKILLWLIVVVN